MVNYTVIEKTNEAGLHHIIILEGVYEGVVFTLGKVSFPEDESVDCAVISFEYNIVERPDGCDTTHNDALQDVLGGILTDLIENMVGKEEISYVGGTD